jgi:hypothetical protein
MKNATPRNPQKQAVFRTAPHQLWALLDSKYGV